MSARWEDTPARPTRPVGFVGPDELVTWANDPRMPAEHRATCLVLAAVRKWMPVAVVEDDDQPGPWDIDWSELKEVSYPWSSGERVLVQLAESINHGALNDAAFRLDDGNWHRVLDALDVLRGGR